MTATYAALFGMGCFWEPDEYFSHVSGVVRVTAGYTGGNMGKPSYEEVSGGDTGHTEVLLVEFDPTKITYEQLLAHFWQRHDPTVAQKRQYRSVIFYYNDAQKHAAETSRTTQQQKLGKPVVTAIEPATPFYKAEEYHQKYLAKRKSLLGL